MTTSLEQLAHTIDEVCKIAKLGRSSVYEEIRSGRLIARKCGRRTIILATDLRAWLDQLPRIEPEPIEPSDDQPEKVIAVEPAWRRLGDVTDDVLADAKTRQKSRR